MKIIFVNASERFSNTQFSDVVLNDGTSLSNYTDYTCPQCSEQIGFKKTTSTMLSTDFIAQILNLEQQPHLMRLLVEF